MKPALLLGCLFGSALLFSGAHGSSYYSSAHSNGGKAIKHACKDTIREQIWSDHQYIRKVEFTRGSYSFLQESHATDNMRGQGKYLNQKGKWKAFDFSCSYNNRQDRVVKASYRKTSGGNQGWNKHHKHNSGRQACKHEIDRKILRRHDAASRIRWDDRSVKQWKDSSAETGFHGYGRFIGGRNNTRHYEFQCVYNHRRDDVSSSWIKVRD